MGKPQHKVKIVWSPKFAYAIGLLTTDGNMSQGRHINFTSKDEEQVLTFKRCLHLDSKIGRKARGGEKDKKYYVVQFGDVIFYRFLLSIGLTPKKSLTLGEIAVPTKYFMDFVRGHFDGDGTFYSYWDPRWRSSFMFYTEFLSGSKRHVEWIRSMLDKLLHIHGHITKARTIGSVYQLKYAKTESLKLLPNMYYSRGVLCLSRKRLKIKQALRIIGKQDLV